MHSESRQISRRGWVQVSKVSRRGSIGLFLFVALSLATSVMVGCGWFAESQFALANESRLPRWLSVPSGLRRTDVLVTMSYYVRPWGRSARFTMRDLKGKTLTQVEGKQKGLGPVRLKTTPPGFPSGYPAYEVITVAGTTDIVEHKAMEPKFYMTDDPAVWRELDVPQN